MNEEKIIKILEDNFTDSIEFDREKCKDELLILFNVSQQRELLIDGFDFINIHDGDRVKIGKLVDLVLKSINCG